VTSTNRNANVYFSVLGAGDSKAEIDKIRQAAEALGEKGKKGAQGVVDGLTALEREANNVERKLNTTGVAGERDLRKLVGAVEVLKSAAISAFGSLANAPVELQHAVQKGEAEIKKASEAVGKLNNAVRDNKAHVEAAANQWTGLQGALEGLGGKAGAFVGKWGLVTAAFEQGWSIGMKLNKLFGTDMSLWEEQVDHFGQKVGLIVRDIADIGVAYLNAFTATLRGNFAEAKRSLTEAGADIFKLGRDTKTVLTEYGADWERAGAKLGVHNKTSEEAAKAAEKLREKQTELRAALATVTLELQKQNQELAKQKTSLMDAEHGLSDSSASMGRYKAEVERSSTAIDDQKAKIEDLSSKFGESSLVVKGAKEDLQRLEASLRTSQQRYETARAEVDRYEQQQRSAQESIREHEGAITELNKKRAEEEKALKKVTDGLGGPGGYVEKLNAAATSSDKVAQNTEKIGFATISARPGVENLTTELHKQNAELSAMDALLGSVLAKLAEVPAAAGAASSAFHELKDAAAGAAGGDGGSSGPPAPYAGSKVGPGSPMSGSSK
jgi:chromosome segregation ATPase